MQSAMDLSANRGGEMKRKRTQDNGRTEPKIKIQAVSLDDGRWDLLITEYTETGDKMISRSACADVPSMQLHIRGTLRSAGVRTSRRQTWKT